MKAAHWADKREHYTFACNVDLGGGEMPKSIDRCSFVNLWFFPPNLIAKWNRCIRLVFHCGHRKTDTSFTFDIKLLCGPTSIYDFLFLLRSKFGQWSNSLDKYLHKEMKIIQTAEMCCFNSYSARKHFYFFYYIEISSKCENDFFYQMFKLSKSVPNHNMFVQIVICRDLTIPRIRTYVIEHCVARWKESICPFLAVAFDALC